MPQPSSRVPCTRGGRRGVKFAPPKPICALLTGAGEVAPHVRLELRVLVGLAGRQGRPAPVQARGVVLRLDTKASPDVVVDDRLVDADGPRLVRVGSAH